MDFFSRGSFFATAVTCQSLQRVVLAERLRRLVAVPVARGVLVGGVQEEAVLQIEKGPFKFGVILP